MTKTLYGISFDPSRCSGCFACIAACMDQNDLDGMPTAFRQVCTLELNNGDEFGFGFVSLACFHCSEAPCLKVCPAKAITMDEEMGVVLVDSGKCIGCKACSMACPFGAPKFDHGGKMFKCDLCIERVKNGMEPACVHTCTTRALEFIPLDEMSGKKIEKIGLKIFYESSSVA